MKPALALLIALSFLLGYLTAPQPRVELGGLTIIHKADRRPAPVLPVQRLRQADI